MSRPFLARPRRRHLELVWDARLQPKRKRSPILFAVILFMAAIAVLGVVL